jgi:hypothetical protein
MISTPGPSRSKRDLIETLGDLRLLAFRRRLGAELEPDLLRRLERGADAEKQGLDSTPPGTGRQFQSAADEGAQPFSSFAVTVGS